MISSQATEKDSRRIQRVSLAFAGAGGISC